ncbi:molecular chaperone [Vibrio genomosp. F6]|uniref:Molecular chaperone n=1 Tax=Vibrio genomosp. F6 str. FF-238 TaxID=1191298 RepID=A0A1E5D8T5_9VIBR|nr:molecular chaperone [Vibrio genomosp. F6]OEE80167.1 molecular chaperone [Vibrio genomosp. F6 str. FF-238]
MFIGFDYGTANCSVASMSDGQPRLLSLEGDNFYIPSTICAPTRESVSEYLFRHFKISPSDAIGEQVLRRAIAFNREESIDLIKGDLAFGQAALDLYLEDPRDVYYVKSPKSFLGASGLHDIQVSFFEDLVCAMMANIKQKAEAQSEQEIRDTVIGRPINFHGRGGELANQQAEKILLQAAKRAGFNNIEFQFEPVAAGLEYESTLTEDKTVLVVDIGGGTTDCSLIDMGPTWRGMSDRTASLLAHSGQRVGGNDLDIYLAFKQLMTSFGSTSKSLSGIDMPLTQFWNPIAINNVEAQRDFYSRENLKALKLLKKEAQSPEKLDRLLRMYQETLGYSVVRKAEEAKIALADCDEFRVKMDLVSELVEVDISLDQMIDAIETPKAKMVDLVKEAVAQSAKKPDVIFMTGGSARSPVLRQAVESQLPNVPIVSGNYFGSVTAGLARWAETCFK